MNFIVSKQLFRLNERWISSNYRPLSNVLSVIPALHHVLLFMDGTCFLLVPVKTAIDPQLLQTRCSDSTCNEQIKTSVCLINFDGSTANVMLFSFQKILLFWKVFGWSRIILISTKACAVLLYWSFERNLHILIFFQKLYDIENKWQKMRGWTRGSQKSHADQHKILCGVRT